MPESIFSIAIIIFLLGLLSYILYTIGLFVYGYYANKKLEKDIKNYDKILAEENKYEEYLSKNGFAYPIKERYTNNDVIEKEIELCSRFIEEYPNNLHSRERRGILYSILGKYEEAINDFRNLIKKAPDDFSYVLWCAKQYAKLNEINTSFDLINIFYKNKNKDEKYFNAIGEIFYIAKDFELSIKNHTEAIKLNPEYPFYYRNRANAYKEIGEISNFEYDMQKYKELLEKVPTIDNLK